MYNYIRDLQLLLVGLLLTIGLIVGVKIVSSNNSGITVTGSAYEIVKSDSATLRFDLLTRDVNKAVAYTQIQKQIPVIKDYLKEKGIKEEEITISAPTNYVSYKSGPQGYNTNEILAYNFTQPIKIKSDDIEKIKNISTDVQSLLEKGLNINTNTPEYNYSKLAELKIKLLGEATKDAKVRATEMLKATNDKVGKIKSIKMGVFQITSPTSNEVSDWGINDNSSIEKKVTAVANVVFNVK